MLSTKVVSLFTAFALSMSALAAPMPQLPGLSSLPAVSDLAVPAGALAPVTSVVDTVASKADLVALKRTEEVKSIAVVFSESKTVITSYTEQIKVLTVDEIQSGQLVAIVGEIVETLKVTLSGLQALVGQPLSVILCDVNSTVTLTVSEVATIVADLLCLILSTLYNVLALVTFDLSIVSSVLAEILSVLVAIITVVLSLVDGLLVALVPALTSALGEVGLTLDVVLEKLNCTVIGTVLQIVS